MPHISEFAAEFHNKTFYCGATKMGFIYQDDTIIKVVPGLWADTAGLRVGDRIVRIQTEYPADPVTQTDGPRKSTGDLVISFTDFGPLSPKEKILRLKRKAGVGFIVTREVLDMDLHAQAAKLQAVYRGKKTRRSLAMHADAEVQECVCFGGALDTKPNTCSWISTPALGMFCCAGQAPAGRGKKPQPVTGENSKTRTLL